MQNLKKRKVTIHISVNGVRVVLKKRRRKVSQCLITYIHMFGIIELLVV